MAPTTCSRSVDAEMGSGVLDCWLISRRWIDVALSCGGGRDGSSDDGWPGIQSIFCRISSIDFMDGLGSRLWRCFKASNGIIYKAIKQKLVE